MKKRAQFPSFGTAGGLGAVEQSGWKQHAFLSDQAEKFRLSLRPVTAEFMLAARLSVASVLADIDRLDGVPLGSSGHFGIALFERSLEACQAAVLLADRGMSGSGFSVLRTAYECLFFVAALWSDPEVEGRIKAQARYDRRKKAERILREKPESELRADSLRQLKEILAAPQATGTGISVEQAAKIAGMTSTYATIFSVLSSVGSHATEDSLAHYAPEVVDDSLLRTMGPNFRASELIFRGAVDCLKLLQERFRAHFSFQTFGPSMREQSRGSPHRPQD